MKWLLIASAMNLQLTYGDEASCRSAQSELKQEKAKNITEKSEPEYQSIDMNMEKAKRCMQSYGKSNCEL